MLLTGTYPIGAPLAWDDAEEFDEVESILQLTLKFKTSVDFNAMPLPLLLETSRLLREKEGI